MKTLIIIAAGLFLIGMNSCFYDKADLIYPQVTSCDTTAVTYSGTVAKILTSNCNGCHGGAAAAGAGIKLDTYTTVSTYVTNGRLLNSMLHNGQASPMPKGGTKLDACTINKVSSWIKKGAANN